MILSELAPVVGAHQAEFYMLAKPENESPKLKLLASYASKGRRSHGKEMDVGEGLVGQCAIEKRKLLLTNVPSEAFRIATGLSESTALDVLVMPVVFEGEVRGVMELASLEHFNPSHQAFLDQLTESIGIVINTIEANTRTEDLLKQSQSLAEELQQTNQELEEKARQLAHQNQEVERKNTEVEQARQALEEKAKQLALTSKYKSEFLANMSHELRTPLNSLLLLSDQLTRNAEGNLNLRQVEAAKTIHASGNDLLALINDILDLSKIESGTVQVDVCELRLLDLQRYVERTFRHIAESSRVGFNIQLDAALPRSMHTDIKRMQQIIKNLLSNAFKFTHEGSVTFTVAPAASGWSSENDELNRAGQVIAFSVSDTGIGISADKQQIIFEAFQQADGSTSQEVRRHGPGSRDQPRALEAPRRRDPAHQLARGGQHLHAVPAAFLRLLAARAGRPGAARDGRSNQPAPRGAEGGRGGADLYRAGGGAGTERRRRRPRRHQARRPVDPDRGERPRVREGAARGGARAGLQGPGRRAPRQARSPRSRSSSPR